MAMNSIPQCPPVPAAAGLPFALLLLAQGLAAQGRCDIATVVPSAYEHTEANGQTVLPFGATVPMRIMYAYGRSVARSDRPMLLEGIRLRPEGGAATGVAVSYSFQLSVSTSRNPARALVPRFDDNHGADRTVVKGGTVQLSAQSLSQSPNPFVLHIPFNTHFEWDPRSGPLLLDFQYQSGSVPSGLAWDAATTTGEDVGRIADLTSSSAQVATFQGGNTQNLGMVLELCVRPEVIPDGYRAGWGNSAIAEPFGSVNPSRVLTVYGADEMPFAGRHRITGLGFRTRPGVAFPGATYDLTVRMMLWGGDPNLLSTLYWGGLPGWGHVLFRGIHTAPPQPAQSSPGRFAVVIPLDTPIEYDPSRGQTLAIEVATHSVVGLTAATPFDATRNTANVYRIWGPLGTTHASFGPEQSGLVVGLIAEPAATLPEAAEAGSATPTHSVYPFNHRTPHRVMQLYGGDTIAPPSLFIQHLRWRPANLGSTFGPVTYTCTIDLSSRPSGQPLSPVFDNNHGSDRRRVFAGTFSVPFMHAPLEYYFREYPISVKLDTPFHFVRDRWPLPGTNDLIVDIRMLDTNGDPGSCHGLRDSENVWRQVHYSDPNALVANHPSGGGPDHFALSMRIAGDDPNATSVNYGTGCPGSNGIPRCATDSRAGLPNPEFRVQLVNARSGAAFLVLGLTQTSVPLASYGMPGCTLLTGGELGLLFAWVPGSGSYPASRVFALPGVAAFSGFTFTTQWAILDSGANPAGVVMSDAQLHTALFR